MKKALVGIIISAFFVMSTFSSFITIHAADDKTAPTWSDLVASTNQVKPGDTITFTVSIKDSESGVGDCALDIKSPTGTTLDPKFFKYNETSGLYELTLTIFDNFENGVWSVYRIQVSDVAGNSKMSSLTSPKFTVSDGYVKDTIKPTWKNLTMSTNNVKPGDTIHFTVEIYDDKSGPANGALSFHNSTQTTDDMIFLTLNSSTGLFEGSINVTSDFQDGLWTVYQIQAIDNDGNNRMESLSGYTFKMSGGVSDVTPPTWKNLKMSDTAVQPGDSISFSVEIYDSGTGPDNAAIYISGPNGAALDPKFLTLNSSTGLFEGKINIALNSQIGVWTIYKIQANDKYGNNRRDTISNLSFEVKPIITYGAGVVIKDTVFKVLDGVIASSKFEGDITKKLTFVGKVDSSVLGLSLIKYSVIGKTGNVYTDYRWIAVIEGSADPAGGALSFNEDVTLSLGASSSLVTITKDGKVYVLDSSGVISEEGTFVVSLKYPSSASFYNGYLLSLGWDLQFLASKTNVKLMTFSIDKTAPVITGVEESKFYDETQIKFNEGVATLNDKPYTANDLINEPGNYTIKVMDRSGNISKINFSINYALLPPDLLKASNGSSGSVKLSWNLVDTAVGYEILRSSTVDGSYDLIGTSIENNYIDQDVQKDATYYYEVKAYKMSGESKKYSQPSSGVKIKVIDNSWIYLATIVAVIFAILLTSLFTISKKIKKSKLPIK
jgi:acyl dehydratase